MKKVLTWLPTLLWMGFIFFMSSRPSIKVASDTTQEFLIKKAAHMFEYATLTLLFTRSFSKTTKVVGPRLWITIFIVVVLYAASDEFHQSFIPTREPRIRDVFIDAAGSLVAIAALHLRTSYYRSKAIKTIG